MDEYNSISGPAFEKELRVEPSASDILVHYRLLVDRGLRLKRRCPNFHRLCERLMFGNPLSAELLEASIRELESLSNAANKEIEDVTTTKLPEVLRSLESCHQQLSENRKTPDSNQRYQKFKRSLLHRAVATPEQQKAFLQNRVFLLSGDKDSFDVLLPKLRELLQQVQSQQTMAG